MSKYITLAKAGESELVIQKSRFIASGKEVLSVAEAEVFLSEMREKYPDANHHCYAFKVLGPPMIERYSDDGEPSGTAGVPIHTVLKHHLNNAIVVITRYFGGTKLGKGGLVKAYTEASKLLIETQGVLEKEPLILVHLEYPYALLDQLNHLLKQFDLSQTPIYEANIHSELHIPLSLSEDVLASLNTFVMQGLKVEAE